MSITSIESGMQHILMSVLQSFSNIGVSFTDKNISLIPGASTAWDNCCSHSGTLYLRVNSIYPSGNPFPNYNNVADCASVMAVNFSVGVYRCAHTVNDYGVAPSSAEITEDALNTYTDSVAIYAGLTSVQYNKIVSTIHPIKWSPIGPEGGCVAGEWSAVAALSCFSFVE